MPAKPVEQPHNVDSILAQGYDRNKSTMQENQKVDYRHANDARGKPSRRLRNLPKKITKIVKFRKVVDENKRRNVSEVGTYFLNHFQYFWQ